MAALRPVTLPVAAELEEAIEDFDCVVPGETDDPVAIEVNDFLKHGEYADGLRLGVSSSYVLLDDSPDPELLLLGYITVSVASVKLSGSERKENFSELQFSEFPALRLVMIGTDYRLQGRGLGSRLLQDVIGLATRVGQYAAVRFLVADVNRKQQEWYEKRQFVVNRSGEYKERPDTISMRFDLQ